MNRTETTCGAVLIGRVMQLPKDETRCVCLLECGKSVEISRVICALREDDV